ncbi:hypothetical protein E5676_scaffold177G001270 [Cucumis melo var. makuwa]|uniref:Uncharacterized protein n=1 Tax=Cucumis melo var. makuwa TaxID=1194695 RepID=A0A5D3CK85_CUCMM|nr:hypothetical protein E5676_scaffold177G001270 [Cucumis melo var. makuwa]
MNVTMKVVKEEVNVNVIILNDQQKDAIETFVLREDTIDFCNMREAKTLTLVAYMAAFWLSEKASLKVSLAWLCEMMLTGMSSEVKVQQVGAVKNFSCKVQYK